MKTRFSLFLLLVLPLKLASAATYYVDASFGNDNWGGQQVAPLGSPATDGPWQSLAKVSARVLGPGDSVLLKCGGIWNETLTLKNSGTASSPITIGAYPSGCTNKPIISGATPIPAHNWIRDTGNIYKISSAIDLIADGTFENGLGNWGKWSPQNDATMGLTNSCAQTNNTCMTSTAGSTGSNVGSNSFPLQGKRAYTATFSMKSPAGVPIWVIVRRGSSPWDVVGLAQPITGTGAWQTLTLPFTATASLSNARLNFDVPAGRNIGLDNVKITTPITDVLGVFNSGKTINVAHHPNRGYDSLKPESLFYTVAENADLVSRTSGGSGSSYLTTGPDLSASVLAAITPGTGIRVRTNAWDISDRKIASVSGSRLTFDILSNYPITKDWGYYFYGQRWMLDEPGEWHFNTTTKTISVWMADNSAPGNRVSIGERVIGIDATNEFTNQSNIRIEGIAVQNVITGVRMNRATNTLLRNMNIFDTLGMGVVAIASTDSGVEGSQLIRTGGDAISVDGVATRFHAYDNLVMDSSVQSKDGIVTSLPVHARMAIEGGLNSVIRGNRIYGAGYLGIWPYENSLVSGNHIENTCLILDDCGAIGTRGNNSIIENNTVVRVVGGLSGKPTYFASEAQGIYVDDLAAGVTIRGNTIVDAQNGINLHNARNTRVENNTLYSNRAHQIRLQEDSKTLHTEGDVYGNLILNNRIFPKLFSTLAKPAIGQLTGLAKSNTDRFASYDRNHYFTLLSPVISTEIWPSGGAAYTLPTWQSAVTATNLSRNLDPTASEVSSASISYAPYRIFGTNIVPNGKLSAGITGWSAWNETAPYGQIVLESCTPASQCLRYTAGATQSLLSSPNFSVQKDQAYKVSFDLKTGTNNQIVEVVTRRGGGGSNGYEAVMEAPFNITGATTWRRYSFIFEATATINVSDPITLDNGARVDFNRILPGQNITVANLEMVPLSAADATLRSHILVNPTGAALALNCPDGNNALLCSEYVRFTDNQSVTWPYTLAPNGSEIIYSRDSSLTDSDGDSILDSQDLCNGTGASLAVNASGCALEQ